MKMLGNVRHWWQGKQSTWMQKRIAKGAHLLGKRSIFILPTRQGFYLAFFLFAMLLACINYNLSLGYMLTFFVFSVTMGAMHRTHQNLLGTRVEALPSEPIFAGAVANLQVQLSNSSALNKFALQVATRPARQSYSAAHANIASQAALQVSLELPLFARGIHPLPALEVSSVYPLGLWRAWSYVFPIGELTVYPEPLSPLPPFLALPQHNASAAVSVANSRDTQGDAVSHIETTDTAAARRIHWPALAKGQLAQRIMDNEAPVAQGVLLSLASCTVAGIEAKLSQLCFAVLHCQSKHIPFVMQLGQAVYPASEAATTDAAHVVQCLQALAAYE